MRNKLHPFRDPDRETAQTPILLFDLTHRSRDHVKPQLEQFFLQYRKPLRYNDLVVDTHTIRCISLLLIRNDHTIGIISGQMLKSRTADDCIIPDITHSGRKMQNLDIPDVAKC